MDDFRDLRLMWDDFSKKAEIDLRKLEAKVDKLIKLPHIIDIETLMKSMVWALDLGDMDLWLSIWSDDAQYLVENENIIIKGKRNLKQFAERSLFVQEKRRFTILANTVIESAGDTALGKDYFTHYGYPVNAETGEVSEKRSVSEGMHHYRFRKDEDGWRITRLEVYIHRRVFDVI